MRAKNQVRKASTGHKSPRDIEGLVKALQAWFGRNARDLPWRRTRDPYGIWVSEIMLQQTQVKTVIPYWKRWMRKLPTIGNVARAKPQKIHKLWEGLGYYSRARNLQKAAQTIIEEHKGEFPIEFAEVIDLPGIGRYTAGAICSIAFDQPTPILDGNVARVLTRLYAIRGDPREKKTNRLLWQIAEELVRQALTASGKATKPHLRPCSDLNQSLMELGALICAPKKPKCRVCPVVRFCKAAGQGREEEFPETSLRKKATRRRFAALVVSHRNRFLVRQRPDAVVNAQLWEFPNLEILNGEWVLPRITKQLLGVTIGELRPLCEIKHSITRFLISLEAYRAELQQPWKCRGHGSWLTVREMKRLAFSSAHKQILERL